MTDVLVTPAFLPSSSLDSGDTSKLGPIAWKASRLFTGGGNARDLCMRDGASATGASWVAPNVAVTQADLSLRSAVGKVLVGAGVGVDSVFSASPSLTDVTLSGALNLIDTNKRVFGVGNDIWLQSALGSVVHGVDNGGSLGSSSLRWGTGYFGTALILGTNPSTTGTVRLAHGATVSGRESTNANNRVLIDWGAATADKLLVGHVSHRLQLQGSDIEWMKALVALGGGAAPTFGTIGGAGPATAAQNSWMRIVDSAGGAFWVPAWK